MKDYRGHSLESGFYILVDPLGIEVCYLDVNGKSFSAKNRLGYVPISNFEEAARNFIPFSGNDTVSLNARFVLSEIEELSKKT